MKEINLRVVLLGGILSVVMGAANVYLGLKVGMTVAASIPAAVIASVIFKKILRGGTILESNQVQTAASAGESLAAGIIFTMPALVLIGAWTEFDWFTTTAIALTGGLLGILFMIPMRKVFIINNDELKFPEGVACAEVLKASEEEASEHGASNIIKGALVGGAFKFLEGFTPILKYTLEGASWFKGKLFYFGGDISPVLVSVGYIVGLNVAFLIFMGGAIGWLVGIPYLSSSMEAGDDALSQAWGVWSTQVRYVGVGAMVIAGIDSIWAVRKGLVQAISEIKSTLTTSSTGEELDKDISSKWIVGIIAVCAVLVGAIYYQMTGSHMVAIISMVIMGVMAFFFTAVASYIVGLVGSSNSPVSGMTISVVLFTGVFLSFLGYTGMEGMIATLGVASIVCCVACTSGDVCNDLKTGSIVGASPYRQQMMQIFGVLVASLVMAPVLQLLHDYTPGGIGGRNLSAPQAALFANLAKGFFGEGVIPWGYVKIGAALGVVTVIIDSVLSKRGSDFRVHLMPVAVGIYLPFGISVPLLIGGIIKYMFSKSQTSSSTDQGVLLSSGVIAGESLMGVGLSLFAAAGISRFAFDLSPGASFYLTVAASILFVWFFIRTTKGSLKS